MFYKDNWLAWTYDDGIDYGPKLTPNAECKFLFRNVINRPVKSYHEELLENARIIRDTFGSNLDLLFSGGIDSEVVLRCYHELKIPINVYIFKYEDDLNKLDVACALSTCNELGITPKIIDFNLKKFFENDAYDIWKNVYSFSAGWLPHMKMTEYCDGIPIIASGEPYARRTSRDWTNTHSWLFEIDEASHHWGVYHNTIGRKAITDWYEYSPEVTVSYFQLPYVQRLIYDKIQGKLSNISSKAIIHQEYWPTLAERIKLIGFEGPVPDKEKQFPDFMIDFEKRTSRGVIKRLTTTTIPVDELLSRICYG
jgi:Queuosine biosynthesis protein QueC